MRSIIKNTTLQKGGADMPLLLAVCFLFVCIGGSFIYFSLYGATPINNVKTLVKTIETATPITYYAADVRIQPEGNASTSAVINGTVAFNTLQGSGSGQFSFPLSPGKLIPRIEVETLFFSDATYAKFHLNNANGESLIQYPEDWIHFSDMEQVPEQYEILRDSLALSDVLELFRKAGKYVQVDGPVEKQLGGTVATLKFSLRASQVETFRPEGVSSSFDTLLKNGNVNVWVSSKDKIVQEIRFAVHGYVVTMKIKDIDKTVITEKPGVSLSLSEWKAKQFSSYTMKERVSEIFIGSYGSIKKEYLEAIRSAVEKATGIKAVVLLSGAALPEKPPLWSETRRQFDAVPVYKSVKSASEKYGGKARFIYVLDTDMYSSSDKSAGFAWSLSEIGSNTTLMSLFPLRKMSDSNVSPANQSLVISRAQKVALSILGASVGYSLSPSSVVPECLTYKTESLEVLDKQGTDYCLPEISLIKKTFGK